MFLKDHQKVFQEYGKIWIKATLNNTNFIYEHVLSSSCCILFSFTSSRKLISHLRYLVKGNLDSSQTFKYLLFIGLLSLLPWAGQRGTSNIQR